MSGLTRQEMKRDEVREWIVVAIDWIADHVKVLFAVLGGLIALGVVLALVFQFLGNRAQRAQEELAEAIRFYTAPIDAATPDPDDAKNPVFASEADRGARAEPIFERVHERFGSTAAGRIAGAYLGEIAASRGDFEAARQHWQRYLEKDSQSALAATVRLDLISLERQTGAGEQLAADLRDAIESGSWSVPSDVLLWELGLTLEQQGQPDEARDAFQRLVDEHPTSAYATRARERIGDAA
ncbi:MAG TPA: tetratricopeptide repeat protein [Thermoanaerobaculia bacterium]|nr:tetratricopeptide repeat protein [Thermoanaerobaculia bacterium]